MEKPPIINNINNKYLPMQNNNIKIEKNNNDINNKIEPKENTNNIIIKNKAPIIEKAKTYLIQKTKEKEPEQKPKNIKINPAQEKPIKTTIANNNYRLKAKEKEKEKEEIKKINPNPTNGNITICGDEINMVEVYNICGQKVMTIEANSSNVNVNMSALTTGVYMVKITDKNGNETVNKVVKK